MDELRMKTIVPLDSIWNFLQSLSLSANNKRWLGEKLLEEAKEENAEKKLSYAEFVNSLCGSWREDSRSTEEIISDIHNSHQFGVTRHIMPLSNEEK